MFRCPLPQYVLLPNPWLGQWGGRRGPSQQTCPQVLRRPESCRVTRGSDGRGKSGRPLALDSSAKGPKTSGLALGLGKISETSPLAGRGVANPPTRVCALLCFGIRLFRKDASDSSEKFTTRSGFPIGFLVRRIFFSMLVMTGNKFIPLIVQCPFCMCPRGL